MGNNIMQQINYSNNKQYGDYAITPIQAVWNKPNAELNFRIYTKHVEDSIRIINSTTEPLVFFYRFDFAVKRSIDLCYMAKYVKSSESDLIKKTKNLIASKQNYIHNLIIRINEKASIKIASLKTEKGRMNNILKIKDSFSPYLDEMSRENVIFFNNVIESLKSGSKLTVPAMINTNQTGNNVENNNSDKKKSGCGCGTLIIVFLLLLVLGKCGKHDNNSNSDSEADIQTVTTQSVEIKSSKTTKETTTKPVTTEATTEEETEVTTTKEVPKLSEMELLTLENHPKFFGSFESAKAVWNRYTGEDSIMIKDKMHRIDKDENAIMVLECYYTRGAFAPVDSDIRGINIRFNNFKKDTEVSFEQGLALAEEYFPDDIFSQHYHKLESFYQDSENQRNYVVAYVLNDGESTEEYPQRVSVVLYTNEAEKMESLKICCDIIGHSRFEPEKFYWNYDFLST